MAEPHSKPAPISDAVTNQIRVEVLSRYSPENSNPQSSGCTSKVKPSRSNAGRYCRKRMRLLASVSSSGQG